MRSETYSCARQQVGGRFQKLTKTAEGAEAAEGIWRTSGMYGLSCLCVLYFGQVAHLRMETLTVAES